jgi:hypothetical protein
MAESDEPRGEQRGGHPRGVVTVEFLGETRRLRASLNVDGELKERTGHGFFHWAEEMVKVRRPSDFDPEGTLDLFEVLCDAGGTPLEEGWRDELLMGDLATIGRGIKQAMVAAGVLDEAPEGARPGDGEEGEGAEKGG